MGHILAALMPTFLSTPSARRATTRLAMFFVVKIHFYPRPPRGGRPSASMVFAILCYFYPRPPRGGRLSDVLALRTSDLISIHSLREEGDARLGNLALASDISIHALREEGDCCCRSGCRWRNHFYPRPP